MIVEAGRFSLSSERRELEQRNAACAEAAERVWRRKVRWLWASCFVSQAVATAVGAAGFMVDGERLGQALLTIGKAGVVLFPFTILVIWIAEAHRRGDV